MRRVGDQQQVALAVRDSDLARLPFQHSPSSWEESELGGEVLDLCRGQHFGERVGEHLIGWAINDLEGTLFDDPADEVESDVNMFGAGMVLVVFGKFDSRLVVTKENGWREVDFEELGDKGMEP